MLWLIEQISGTDKWGIGILNQDNLKRFELESFQEAESPEPVPHTKEKRIKLVFEVIKS